MARNQVVRKKANAVNEEVGAPINVDRFEALPAAAVCESARQSRDPRFDGRFFVAVVSTGIFCRPTCPARIPAEHNVRYFANAVAASDAGYRPCRRCHPEASLPMPEWALGNPHIVRALRLIDGGFLNHQPVGALAQRLGMSERHLDRVFMQVLGATPLSIARLKRAQLARQLLATTLPLVQVAEHAGYGSVSQFNREMKRFFPLGAQPITQEPWPSRNTVDPHFAIASATTVQLRLGVRLSTCASIGWRRDGARALLYPQASRGGWLCCCATRGAKSTGSITTR